MSRRLVVSMLCIIGGLWLVGVTYVGFAVHHEIDEVFDSALEEMAQRLLPIAAHDVRDRREHPEGSRLNDLPKGGRKEYIHYQIRDQTGRVLLHSHDAPNEPYPVPLTPGFTRVAGLLYFTEVSPDHDVVVQVAEVPRAREEAIRAVWLGLLIPLLAMVPLAAIGVRETVRRITQPVGSFRNELHSRDGSNLAPLASVGLPEELMPMVDDVNRLLARLSSALEAERTFAASSAHELRNPLAAAQAQARLLVDDAENSDQKRRAEGLEQSLGRLGRKLETLLQLARAEAGVAFAREEVRFDDLSTMMVQEFSRKPSFRDRILYEVKGASRIVVFADPDALGIAIHNLIDNALKHSPPLSKVQVVLGPGARFTVQNESAVLSEDEIAKLRLRFQRGRGGAQNGSGLGLYIADVIARQSGGRLRISSPPPGQATGFEVELDLTSAS